MIKYIDMYMCMSVMEFKRYLNIFKTASSQFLLYTLNGVFVWIDCFLPISISSFQLAYVDGLERDEFFHSLFEDDTEAARLALLPGEKERLEE